MRYFFSTFEIKLHSTERFAYLKEKLSQILKNLTELIIESKFCFPSLSFYNRTESKWRTYHLQESHSEKSILAFILFPLKFILKQVISLTSQIKLKIMIEIVKERKKHFVMDSHTIREMSTLLKVQLQSEGKCQL